MKAWFEKGVYMFSALDRDGKPFFSARVDVHTVGEMTRNITRGSMYDFAFVERTSKKAEWFDVMDNLLMNLSDGHINRVFEFDQSRLN